MGPLRTLRRPNPTTAVVRGDTNIRPVHLRRERCLDYCEIPGPVSMIRTSKSWRFSTVQYASTCLCDNSLSLDHGWLYLLCGSCVCFLFRPSAPDRSGINTASALRHPRTSTRPIRTARLRCTSMPPPHLRPARRALARSHPRQEHQTYTRYGPACPARRSARMRTATSQASTWSTSMGSSGPPRYGPPLVVNDRAARAL
ncbi:uncharacterized protein B0H18DRAFT_1018300 [Fomitopsis serialis]|uniref:uncharacterized protein n=1 Tax=Fomitopsis serialis TaxID=139415 RepID=UPI002008A30A|nr:uncharacterized protein B0H18DRAFT_1018300 [Neoantrodia serialis]KAH9922423.1 hypothetical protein B0H18DRAFT_1018300 [Neoantrodia serialis]